MKNILSAILSIFFLSFLATNTFAQDTNIEAIYSKAETLLYKDNNYTAAVTTAQEGLKLNEQHKDLKTILAIAQYKSGNKPVAHKLFDDLVRQHNDDVNLKVEYAHLIEKENKQKAFRIYESVLEKDADNLKALFFTGQYYTDAASEKLSNGGNQQEVFSLMTKGIECFERYHKLKPEDKTVIESLVQFYESLRMTDKAAEMKKKL